MDRKLNVLILEDTAADAKMLERSLRKAGLSFSLRRVVDEPGFRRALEELVPDVILADYSLPSFDGLSALAIAREKCGDLPFILVSGTLLEERAIDVMRDGATDYVLKQRMERVGPAVLRALAEGTERRHRREAEAALRLSEERLEIAVTGSGVGIWDWDVISGACHYSTQWKRLLGYEEEDLFSMAGAALERIHPDDWERTMVAINDHLEGRAPGYDAEFRLRHRDGSYRWILSRGACYRDADGRPYRMAGTHIDITDRKLVEQRRDIEHSVSCILASSANLNEGSLEILQVVCESLGWDVGGLWSLGSAGSRLTCDHVWCRPGPGREVFEAACRATRLERGESLPGRVWASGQLERIPDLGSDPGLRRGGAAVGCGLQAGLAFPIISDGVFRGVLEFFTRDAQPPDVDLLRTLGSVGSQLGQFIERKRAEEALRGSEGRLRHLVSATPAVIYSLKMEGDVLVPVWMSQHLERLMGYQADGYLTGPQWYWDRLHPEERDAVEAELAGLFQDDRLVQDYRFRHRDGQYLWIRDEKVLLRDEEGRPVEVIGSWVDITSRKEAEQRLARRVRLASLAAEIGVLLTGGASLRETVQGCAESLVAHVDAALARIWLLPEGGDVLELEASAGMSTHLDGAYSRVPLGVLRVGRIAASRQPYLTGSFLADLEVSDAGDDAIGDPEWARRADMAAFAGYPLIVGEHLVGVVALFSPEELPDEALSTLEAVARQLAIGIQQKQAAQRLGESEARKSAILEGALDAIVTMDHAGMVVEWNPAAERIFGRSSGDALGGELAELVIPERLRAMHRRALAVAGSTGEGPLLGKLVEVSALRADGSEFPVELFVTPIVTGGARLFTGFLRDITVRREGEHSLLEANRLLEAALSDLSRAQSKVVEQERLRALGQMASGIAHDFNNALSPILGFSELLLMRPEIMADRETTLSYLDMIHTGARDAASVVRRLREFYRPRGGQDVSEPIDLNALVAQAVELTRPRWRDQAMARAVNIQVRMLPGEIPPVSGDESHVREALTNLIFNAVDAMVEGGTLTLRTAPADERGPQGQVERVRLEVSDTGTGMTEETRQRCLEPFYSTKGEDGTGLGLSMVYGIIARHAGTLEIESALGEGTTVSMTLPAFEQGAARAAAIEPAAPVGLRVLVVDDEDTVRKVTTALFAAGGHSVTSFASGLEGLQALALGSFDLIVTDRAMPGMNGDQLAVAARRLAPGVPIILLTGFGDLMLARDECPPGVDVVVSKPLTLGGLHQAMQAVLPARAMAALPARAMAALTPLNGGGTVDRRQETHENGRRRP